MVIAFQVILLITIVIAFIGTIGEKDKSLQEKMFVMFLGSLAAFIVSVLWL